MSLAEKYMVWIDGEPTKGTSNSFEVVKKIAEQSATKSNKVEIKTTNGPCNTWQYCISTNEFNKTI